MNFSKFHPTVLYIASKIGKVDIKMSKNSYHGPFIKSVNYKIGKVDIK
jgi:hypothetical protein